MLKDLGDIAVKLSRNPIGIIGLSMVLVYGVAGYVTSSSLLDADDRSKLVWFVILFPVLILGAFYRLVALHFEKLYGPTDFTDEKNFLRFSKRGAIPSDELPSESESATQTRHPIEYKILNTLWTKQVNRWPDMSMVWTFRIYENAPEFLQYCQAAAKLRGEQLIREAIDGQIFLSPSGMAYCKEHYKEFPADQWWPKEQIDQDKLRAHVNGG